MDSSDEQLRQLIIPLFAVTNDATWHALGTAFVIAALGRHALLVTAAHNLDHFRSIVSPPPRHHPGMPSILVPPTPTKIVVDGPELIGIVKKRGKLETATLGAASMIPGIDVALLSLTLAEDTECSFERAFALDSTPVVPVGTPITAFGYPSLKVSSQQDWDKKVFMATVNEGSIVARRGEVLSNVEAGTENRFTGIYVSSPFDSGMSGGPVVELRNDEPFVRGVITSDLSEDPSNPSAGSGARAFASSIWLLAGLRAAGVNIAREDGSLLVEPLGRDLIAMGKVRDVGEAHKYVRVEEGMDGDAPTLRSLLWVGSGVG